MTGQSQQLEKLAGALAKAQEEFPTIEPDGTGQVGTSRKYKYATLAKVIATVRPTLAKHALAVAQTCEPADPGAIRLTTTLLHDSGQYIQGSAVLRLVNDTPQGYGSALTYARRYQYAAILGIATEDDDDGHEGSQTQAQPAARQQRATQAQQPKPAANGTGKPPEPAWRAVLYEQASKEQLADLAVAYAKAKGVPKVGQEEIRRDFAIPADKATGDFFNGRTLGSIIDHVSGGGQPPAERAVAA